MNKTERLEGVLAAGSVQDVAKQYDDWADAYEKDMAGAGYRTPSVISGLLCRYVKPDDGPILDAGVGTGVGGEILSLLGYDNLVGIDASQGMLGHAQRKGLYRELKQAFLGEPLDLPDDTFAAVNGMGILLPGHAPPEALDELVRVTKPGGVLIYNVGAKTYAHDGFKAKHEALEKEGKWEKVEHVGPFQSVPLAVDSFESLVCVYRVL